jgi:hypothetical protein
MIVYLKIFPRDFETAVFISPMSSTSGKQSKSKMSNSDGILQTNQPFSIAKREEIEKEK